jgi:hypothetical protein
MRHVNLKHTSLGTILSNWPGMWVDYNLLCDATAKVTHRSASRLKGIIHRRVEVNLRDNLNVLILTHEKN